MSPILREALDKLAKTGGYRPVSEVLARPMREVLKVVHPWWVR